jgi:hypothetical protein
MVEFLIDQLFNKDIMSYSALQGYARTEKIHFSALLMSACTQAGYWYFLLLSTVYYRKHRDHNKTERERTESLMIEDESHTALRFTETELSTQNESEHLSRQSTLAMMAPFLRASVTQSCDKPNRKSSLSHKTTDLRETVTTDPNIHESYDTLNTSSRNDQPSY